MTAPTDLESLLRDLAGDLDLLGVERMLRDIADVREAGGAYLRALCAHADEIADAAERLDRETFAESTRIFASTYAAIGIEAIGIGMLVVFTQHHIDDLRAVCRASATIASALAPFLDVHDEVVN